MVNKMTRCTLLDTWFDSESKKIDEFELKNKENFLQIDKKRGKIWTYIFNFGQN